MPFDKDSFTESLQDPGNLKAFKADPQGYLAKYGLEISEEKSRAIQEFHRAAEEKDEHDLVAFPIQV